MLNGDMGGQDTGGEDRAPSISALFQAKPWPRKGRSLTEDSGLPDSKAQGSSSHLFT